MQEFLIKLVLYVAPMYFANSCAMLFGGKTPIDLNKKFFDSRPVFGKGKTFRGLIFGIATGVIISIILQATVGDLAANLSDDYILLGSLLSIGAVLGDIAGSFLKRRMGLEEGKEAPLLDQLDFVVGAIILGSIVYLPTIFEAAAVIISTPFIHRISNYLAFKINLKKVPW